MRRGVKQGADSTFRSGDGPGLDSHVRVEHDVERKWSHPPLARVMRPSAPVSGDVLPDAPGFSSSVAMRLPFRILFAVSVLALLVGGSLSVSLAPPSAHGFDLWLHGLTYGGLTVLFAALFGSPLLCALFLLVFSIAIEGLQTLTPGRFGTWVDIAANSAGIAAGLVVVTLLMWSGVWIRISALLRRR